LLKQTENEGGHVVPFVKQLIRERAYRQAVLQDIVERLQKVIQERAEAYQDPKSRADLLGCWRGP
jgi:hypothetical protein